MSNNFILAIMPECKIVNMNVTNGYSFTNGNFKRSGYKSVTLYDDATLNQIILKKCTDKYQAIAKMMESLFSDGDSDGNGVSRCLDEASKFKSVLDTKFKAFLKKEEYEMFLNQICYLENYLNQRIYEIEEENMLEQEEEKHVR